MPPYASSMYFELYKRGTEYFVQIFYRPTATEKVQSLNIPDCGTLCPLDQFYKLYEDVLPTESEDRKILCQIKN